MNRQRDFFFPAMGLKKKSYCFLQLTPRIGARELATSF